MTREERARQLFKEGSNCAQSVAVAYADVLGMEEKAAAKMVSSFGGGMGRLREVCGAVSGALMVLGMVAGYSDPKDPTAKKDHYHRVQEFAARSREKNGSIICRELLKGVEVKPGADPELRTEAYYKKRPCPELVYRAAGILEDMLKEQGKL